MSSDCWTNPFPTARLFQSRASRHVLIAQGLSRVTGKESNHRTLRTHGRRAFLFPWFPCFPWFTKPTDCPELLARNPTTEHTEYTEGEPFFFRVFRVFRGSQNQRTVPSYW